MKNQDRLSQIGIPLTHEGDSPSEENVQDRLQSRRIKAAESIRLADFRDQNPGKMVYERRDPEDMTE